MRAALPRRRIRRAEGNALSLQVEARLEAEVGTHVRPGGTRARGFVTLAAVIGVVAFAGCSTSSSSKPGYCADRTNLQNSVKGLTSLNASSGVSGLKQQVSKIQSDAAALVNSAKGDFPSQTSAITSSVDALKNSVAALPASPSAAEITTVTRNASGVVSSVSSFMDASKSACG